MAGSGSACPTTITAVTGVTPGAADWLRAISAAITASLFCWSGGRSATLLSYLVNPRMTVGLSTGQRLLGAVAGANNSASGSRSVRTAIRSSSSASSSYSPWNIRLFFQFRDKLCATNASLSEWAIWVHSSRTIAELRSKLHFFINVLRIIGSYFALQEAPAVILR